MLINNFEVEVNRKQVKNINLKVYPGLTIKASVPENMDIGTVGRMIISKEGWINKQLKRYEEQNRITKRNYVSGEDHYLNGKRYILKVCDSNTPSVKIENNNTMMMYVRKSSSVEYVVIHELLHLIERNHNENFKNLMYNFCPKWEEYHEPLNSILNPNNKY